MSDKSIAIDSTGNEEYTDRPIRLIANVDFLNTADVFFGLVTRALDDESDETTETISDFYIPVEQARAMAEFILANTR